MYGEQPVSASVLSQGKNKYTITFDGSQYEVTGKLAPRLDTNHIELVCDIQGDISKQLVLVNREGVTLYTRDGSYEFALPVPKFLSASAGAGGLGDAVAPMPGVIEKVTYTSLNLTEISTDSIYLRHLLSVSKLMCLSLLLGSQVLICYCWYRRSMRYVHCYARSYLETN